MITVEEATKISDENANKNKGENNMIQIYPIKDILPLLQPSKYYMVSNYLKVNNESTTANLSCDFHKPSTIIKKSENVNSTEYKRIGILICPEDIEGANKIMVELTVKGEADGTWSMDRNLICEINENDYWMGLEFCFAKYPFNMKRNK